MSILSRSPGEGRPDFVGTLDEIGCDVARAHDLGVTEIVFASGFASRELRLDEYFRTLEQLRAVA